MNNKKFIFIGSYVGENVSGSHRQERFIQKTLELKTAVILLKPSGNWIGRHDFNNLSDFEEWKLNYKPNNYKGSISTNRFKKYLIKIKYLFFIDIIGYGFFSTFKLLLSSKEEFKNNYYLVVSSPSISSSVSIYLYSRLFNSRIKYSIDMRDAWANHKSIKIFKNIRKSIEGKVLKRAEHVITVSKYLQEEFEKSYKIKVDLLYNVNLNLDMSFSDSSLNNLFNGTNLNFCYFGSLPSDFYDLNSFCEGLSVFFNTNPQYKTKLKFHFYGPCDELLNILQKYSDVKESCLFYSSIPHDKALHLMKKCDGVLFFGFNADKNAGVVSTKIFEYFYLKVKIIAFDIRENSDLDWLLEKACGQSIFLKEPKVFSNYLKDIFDNIKNLPSCVNKEFMVELDKSYEKYFKDKVHY